MVNTKITKRKRSPTEPTEPNQVPKCPMCPYRSADTEAMRAHLVQCGLRKMEKALKCDHCDYVTDKSGNLYRHKKRHNVTQEKQQGEAQTANQNCVEEVAGPSKSTEDKVVPSKSDPQNNDDDDIAWLRSDPGSLDEILGDENSSSSTSEQEASLSPSSDSSDEDEDKNDEDKTPETEELSMPEKVVEESSMLDPTIRVHTAPRPVYTPKRKMMSVKSAKKINVRELIQKRWKMGPLKVPKVPKANQPKPPKAKIPVPDQQPAVDKSKSNNCKKQKKSEQNESIDTVERTERISIGVQTDFARSRRVIWKTTKYEEGDKQIEIVEMDETEFMDD